MSSWPDVKNKNVTQRYVVEIDGLPKMEQASPNGLEAIVVEDHVDMVGVAEITLSDSADWRSIQVGSEIKVQMGKGADRNGTTTQGPNEYNFVGIVSGVRHSFMHSKDSVTIMAMDPLCKIAGSQRTKVYEEMKDSDIVTQVLGEAGLEVGEVVATPETHKYVLQRNESDFVFLRRLAARNGYLLRSVDGKITFSKADVAGGAQADFAMEQLISIDYRMSDRAIPKKVTAYGWDYVKKEKVEGYAEAGDVEVIGSGTNAVENTGQVYQGEAFISDVFVDSQEAANELARSHLNRLARGYIRGRAIIEGNAGVTAGSVVKFSGSRSKFEPEVYVVSARSRVYVGSGSTTEIVFCGNAAPGGG